MLGTNHAVAERALQTLGAKLRVSKENIRFRLLDAFSARIQINPHESRWIKTHLANIGNNRLDLLLAPALQQKGNAASAREEGTDV